MLKLIDTKVSGNEIMKQIRKDTNAASPLVMVLLGVILIGALVMAVSMWGEAPEPGVIAPGVAQESGTITLSFTYPNGSSAGTPTTASVYMTSADVYDTYADAYEDIDTDGGLVSPYDATDVDGAKVGTPSSGTVDFALVARKYDATNPTAFPGTDFGVVVLDSGTSASTTFAPLVGKIKTTIHKNLDEDIVDQVIEGLEGYLGSTIELTPKGTLSVYDSQSGSYGKTIYTIDTAQNATSTAANSTLDSDFEMTVRLSTDRTALYDVGVYVEELDSYVGTALITLDDVEVYINGVEQTGVSLTKTADLDSGSAEKKNAPSASSTGTSTMWYIEGGEFDIERTNSNNLDEIVIKLIDYDVDLSAVTTTDECRVKFHMVPFNIHEDSDIMTASTFFLEVGEDETTGYT